MIARYQRALGNMSQLKDFFKESIKGKSLVFVIRQLINQNVPLKLPRCV